VKLETYLKSVFVIIGLLGAPHAFSQGDPPIQGPTMGTDVAPPTAQQITSQKVYLELDPADLNALSIALNELPKRVADPLILKLNEQLKNQMQVREAAEKAKK
jgi:hypothetical protein